jgi:hypothetical protein
MQFFSQGRVIALFSCGDKRLIFVFGEGSAEGPSEEGEALSELKNSILGAKKWLANRTATNLLPCNRTGRTCTGDSVTAINLSVLVSQGKFQKVW